MRPPPHTAPERLAWSRPDSPYHEGEQTIQARVGVRERMESVGRRVIRDHLTQEQATFFAERPFVVLAWRDAPGHPCARILRGPPGFVAAPDPRLLRIGSTAVPPALSRLLAPGADVALLGIDFATRRRNRVHGRVSGVVDDAVEIGVAQAFGNCPKYIRTREWDPGPVTRIEEHVAGSLDALDRRQLESAETFFIASGYGSAGHAPSRGVDISHRGGPPGFVQVADARTLIVPDFPGNHAFNTLGNLLLDPRCCLLFPDFERGGGLRILATAEIRWRDPEPPQLRGVPGELRLEVREVVRERELSASAGQSGR